MIRFTKERAKVLCRSHVYPAQDFHRIEEILDRICYIADMDSDITMDKIKAVLATEGLEYVGKYDHQDQSDNRN